MTKNLFEIKKKASNLDEVDILLKKIHEIMFAGKSRGDISIKELVLYS
jgi:hypothetical protein